MTFISTKEHKKFEEFCNSCKDYKYIGLCYGTPGVGKTLSAHQYKPWGIILEFYQSNMLTIYQNPASITIPDEINYCDTVLITASVTDTPSRLEKSVYGDASKLKFLKDLFRDKKAHELRNTNKENFSAVKLLIVDEVDQLRYTSLEQLRIIYDEFGFGMVLIGMPGIERKFSRFPQLYSRVGFLHEFKALSRDEMCFIIEHHLKQLGTTIKIDNFSDYETLNTIARYTKSNFRVLTRLFQQLERLMKINNIKIVLMWI